MNLPRHIRELVEFSKSLDLVATPSRRKNTHWLISLTNSTGDTYRVIVGNSISDHLAMANNRGIIKRFARGVMNEYTRK